MVCLTMAKAAHVQAKQFVVEHLFFRHELSHRRLDQELGRADSSIVLYRTNRLAATECKSCGSIRNTFYPAAFRGSGIFLLSNSTML